jgi:hypothetical protein
MPTVTGDALSVRLPPTLGESEAFVRTSASELATRVGFTFTSSTTLQKGQIECLLSS